MRKTGIVKWFDSRTGMGIIQPEGEEDPHFVHIDSVRKAGLADLLPGQKVSYTLESDLQGRTQSAAQLEVA